MKWTQHFNSATILVHHVKLTFRLLLRTPYLTAIDLIGLSIGFATFIILWHHANSELETDRYHKDFDKIVRIGITYKWYERGVAWGGRMTSGASRFYQAPIIAQDFQQVTSYTRVLQQPQFKANLVGHSNEVVLSVGRKEEVFHFSEDRVVYADPNLTEFFTIPLKYGNSSNVLLQRASVIISETKAKKYFGNQNAVGEKLILNDTVLLTVTGVFQDLPHTTHLDFDIAISNVGLVDKWQENYALTSNYFKLSTEKFTKDFEKQLSKRNYFFSNDTGREDMMGLKLELFVQPLEDIAFSEPFEFDYRPQPKSRYSLEILRIISVLILGMAWINYINHSIPRILKRMKEIATRKIAGALSSDLARQFLVEVGILNLLALILALTLIQLGRKPAHDLLNISIPAASSIHLHTWLFFVVVMVLGTLITGLYPVVMAGYFNSYGQLAISTSDRGRRFLQSMLGVVQFTTALVLMSWVFIVFLQLNFIFHKHLGIERDDVVIISTPRMVSHAHSENLQIFLNKVRETIGVQSSTYSFSVVGDLSVLVMGIGQKEENGIFGMDTNGGVDESFVPFYGIKILAGRNFISTDNEDAVILSRYAIKRIGFSQPEDAVGAFVVTNSVKEGGSPKRLKVVGVIEDYRFKPFLSVGETSTESLTGRGICLTFKNKLLPWLQPNKVSLRIDPRRFTETLASIEQDFKFSFRGNPFNWYFLNDHINKAYSHNRIALNQAFFFTLVAISIACLGLLGTITILIQNKTKEIGIRKVVGAGMFEISLELLKNFYLQIILSVIASLPIVLYLINRSLENYLERINLKWWYFALPVLILVVIMLATITSVLWRAVRSNPMEALKYD